MRHSRFAPRAGVSGRVVAVRSPARTVQKPQTWWQNESRPNLPTYSPVPTPFSHPDKKLSNRLGDYLGTAAEDYKGYARTDSRHFKWSMCGLSREFGRSRRPYAVVAASG